MRGRLRNQDGMTLPEVLLALTIGLVVTLAGLGIVETAMRQSGEAAARIDAVQRGRLAMDNVTRQLRSQACVKSNVNFAANALPRAIEGGTPTSVTFYADLRDTSHGGTPQTPPAGFISGPERRQLEFVPMDADDPNTNWRLIERRWLPRSGTPATATYTYQDPPVARVIIDEVEPVAGRNFFEYYAFDFSADPPQPRKRVPDAPANPLTADEAERVAKIKISYRAQPTQERADGRRASTVFSTDVFARTVDPNAEPTELSTPCL